MEVRKIYINDTARNNVITLETDATTFGEVKAAAIAAGVDISDKDWLEGITKTTPTSDDSLLPTNVSYKGQVTNDLVFLLTNTNKKIKSGSLRSDLYAEIKEKNLQKNIANMFSKNYTNVSTGDLQNFLKSLSYTEEVKEDIYKVKYKELISDLQNVLSKHNIPQSLNLSIDDVLNFS